MLLPITNANLRQNIKEIVLKIVVYRKKLRYLRCIGLVSKYDVMKLLH